ncbi:MAG TPA: hypothetical protein VG929_03130 [Actinomycetota bacterium]|nr:hypothetical protein [Actinomycetota bacterium]
MGGRARDLNQDPPGEVIPLGVDPPEPNAGPPPRTSRLHSFAVLLTAVAALVAVGSTLAFVTVGWPGTMRRAVIAIMLTSTVAFLAGVAMTTLSAARDTYSRR